MLQLLTILLLLVAYAIAPACKRSGSRADLIANSIRFIQVNDKVALTFNNSVAATCSVKVNSQTAQCRKIQQDDNTYYSNLGTLAKDKTHSVELEINSNNIISYKLNYRYSEPTKPDSHYLRLDLQNKVGEIHRTKIATLPPQGCRILNSAKTSKLTPMPLHLQRFITTGFANASASHHARNKNVARIFYSKLDFSSDWDIYLMERQIGTRFVIPSPAKLEHFSIGSKALGRDLDQREQTIPISRSQEATLNWKIKNPPPSIFLTLTIARDDRSVVGECWLDAGQGMTRLESSFWQRLAAGNYSIEAMLISPQRIIIQDDGYATAWQINAYDWRYGHFTKT